MHFEFGGHTQNPGVLIVIIITDTKQPYSVHLSYMYMLRLSHVVFYVHISQPFKIKLNRRKRCPESRLRTPHNRFVTMMVHRAWGADCTRNKTLLLLCPLPSGSCLFSSKSYKSSSLSPPVPHSCPPDMTNIMQKPLGKNGKILWFHHSS